MRTFNQHIKIPSVLYHATYGPYIDSINKHGLGGKTTNRNWTDSVEGVVYLSKTKEEAESFAEEAENAPEDFWDDIVILKINTKDLDKSKIFIDKNNSSVFPTYEYHGVITKFTIIK